MKTGTWLLIAVAVMLFGAIRAENMAAGYIATIGGAIVYLLHVIEAKINKILDQHGVTVTKRDF